MTHTKEKKWFLETDPEMTGMKELVEKRLKTAVLTLTNTTEEDLGRTRKEMED